MKIELTDEQVGLLIHIVEQELMTTDNVKQMPKLEELLVILDKTSE